MRFTNLRPRLKRISLDTNLRFETLENRAMLAGDILVDFGTGAGDDSTYDSGTATLVSSVDVYELPDVRPGDILAVRLIPESGTVGPRRIDLKLGEDNLTGSHESLGVEVVGNFTSLGDSSESSTFVYVLPEDGSYSLEISAGFAGTSGDYQLLIEVQRPVLESLGGPQYVYLDFGAEYSEGPIVTPAEYDLFKFLPSLPTISSSRELTSMSEFLDDWGLFADEPSVDQQTYSAIMEGIRNVVEEDFAGLGLVVVGPWQSDIQLTTPGISITRAVIGGTPAELSLGNLIGKAPSTGDIGNFSTNDIVAVTLSEFPLAPNRVPNPYTVSGDVTRIDLVAEMIGSVLSHELGHSFGLAHTSVANRGLMGYEEPYIAGDNYELEQGESLAFLLNNVVEETGSNIENGSIQNDLLTLKHVLPLAPYIADVTVSSSLSSHTYSFAESLGVGGHNQFATVPVAKANTITLTFSEPVLLNSADLVIRSLDTNTFYTATCLTTPTADGSSIWTWQISNTNGFPRDHVFLSLSDSVTAVRTGLPLDGEWVSPSSVSVSAGASQFPSGDIVPGGSFKFLFTILPGDATRDGIVDDDDYQVYLLNVNQGSGFEFEQGDFDGSGSVNFLDWQVYNAHVSNDNNAWLLLADFNNDKKVDDLDMAAFFSQWGEVEPGNFADFNEDGFVDDLDQAAFFGAWADFEDAFV